MSFFQRPNSLPGARCTPMWQSGWLSNHQNCGLLHMLHNCCAKSSVFSRYSTSGWRWKKYFKHRPLTEVWNDMVNLWAAFADLVSCESFEASIPGTPCPSSWTHGCDAFRTESGPDPLLLKTLNLALLSPYITFHQSPVIHMIVAILGLSLCRAFGDGSCPLVRLRRLSGECPSCLTGVAVMFGIWWLENFAGAGHIQYSDPDRTIHNHPFFWSFFASNGFTHWFGHHFLMKTSFFLPHPHGIFFLVLLLSSAQMNSTHCHRGGTAWMISIVL